ncbi:hypothetical protein N9L76_08355, partial [bacterium]|nr:hypothetical protein [bacterium]
METSLIAKFVSQLFWFNRELPRAPLTWSDRQQALRFEKVFDIKRQACGMETTFNDTFFLTLAGILFGFGGLMLRACL